MRSQLKYEALSWAMTCLAKANRRQLDRGDIDFLASLINQAEDKKLLDTHTSASIRFSLIYLADCLLVNTSWNEVTDLVIKVHNEINKIKLDT